MRTFNRRIVPIIVILIRHFNGERCHADFRTDKCRP